MVIPRQKYLDAVTKSSQPTHFAVRLAELVFGDDVLEASTVTGGKRGTMQLDPVMIKAIQSMLKENTKIVFSQTPFDFIYSCCLRKSIYTF